MISFSCHLQYIILHEVPEGKCINGFLVVINISICVVNGYIYSNDLVSPESHNDLSLNERYEAVP